MEYHVNLTYVVMVNSDSELSAIRSAEAHMEGSKAISVYCPESEEQSFVVDRCEGCCRPILEGDDSGAIWEDGVRTCGDCTALEDGERVAGQPHLSVVR
jgi:hypothetical protein